jgi:hypothetical protein
VPSRYAEPDRLAAFALAEFSGIAGVPDRVAAVVEWTKALDIPARAGAVTERR